MNQKFRFQFSNRTAQKAEAMRNAGEASALLERWVPKAPSDKPEPAETTAAGKCFRNVSAILSGKERRK